MKSGFPLLAVVFFALLQGCSSDNDNKQGADQQAAPADAIKPYIVNVELPASLADARLYAARNADSATAFAVVDINSQTGEIVHIHEIDNASQNEDGSWSVYVDSSPSAASVLIVHENPSAPVVCINCLLPADSIYAPLDSFELDVDVLATVAMNAIIVNGMELSLQETSEFVDNIQSAKDGLAVIKDGQTLGQYVSELARELDSVVGREVFLLSGVPSRPMNDTGVVTCDDYSFTDDHLADGTNPGVEYDVVGSGIKNINLACAMQPVVPGRTVDGLDANGDVIRAGQDAMYGRDDTNPDPADGHAGFSYTKIDADGNELDASAVEWSCVRDNVTGLLWEVKTNDGGLQDQDATYTSYNTSGMNDGGNAGTENGGNCLSPGRCDTEKFVEDVNTMNGGAGLCGHNDWRLPDVQELLSIVNLDNRTSNIDLDYFVRMPVAINLDYWTSTPVSATSNAVIRFADGKVIIGGESNASTFARLVRGGKYTMADHPDTCVTRRAGIYITKPDFIYVSQVDDTVTDTQTGLMWQKCPLGLSGTGCTSGSAQVFTWQAALKAANDNANFGYSDWRLPNVKEMLTLVEVACIPSINANVFPNSPNGINQYFWTSTPYRDDERGFAVFAGNMMSTPSFLHTQSWVRLVRDTR